MFATSAPGSTLRHLLFDLDGTLVDSARLTCAIINAMLVDRGIEAVADLATIRAFDAIGGEAMIAAVMGRHCGDPKAEISEFRARHAAVDIPQDLAFAGVTEGLATLETAGLAMAICSNKPQALCDKILGELRLAGYFKAIVGARPDLKRKPAPDAAFAAMDAIAADPATTLYIGDSAVDVATARAAGLPIALVGWGYGIVEARDLAPEVPLMSDMAALLSHVGSRDVAAKPFRSLTD